MMIWPQTTKSCRVKSSQMQKNSEKQHGPVVDPPLEINSTADYPCEVEQAS